MHPECFMVDTTHGTNKERKELFTVAEKMTIILRSMQGGGGNIPDQQQWVFNSLFSQRLPIF